MKNGRQKARIVIVIFTLLIIFILSLENFKLAYDPIKLFISGKSTFENVIDKISKNYQSDKFSAKYDSITLNGLFARLSGRRVYNQVTLLKNGMLTSNSTTKKSNINTKRNATAIKELKDFANKLGIPFLYVQAPSKVTINENLLPAGSYNYEADKADNLIADLRETDVNFIDLREYIAKNSNDIEQYFYRTDHHWKPEGAFVAFNVILQEIERLNNVSIDKHMCDLSNWEKHEKNNWFLGSRGKRVGPLYAGTDSLIWYTPKEEFHLSSSVPSQNRFSDGGFYEAIIGENYIEKKDYYHINNYSVYRTGDYPLIKLRNTDAYYKQKILLISDSFSLPLKAFLATVFSEVDGLDLRKDPPFTVAEYIQWTKPDMVIVMYSPMLVLNTKAMNFGVNSVKDFVEQKEIYKLKNFSIIESDNTNNHKMLDLKLIPGETYHLSIDDVEVRTGVTNCFTAVLFDLVNQKFIASDIFDIRYAQKKDEKIKWSFTVPIAGEKNTDYRIILYSGLRGETSGIGLDFKNINVSIDVDDKNSKPIFQMKNFEIDKSDSKNNFKTLYTNLIPGETYYLKIDDVKVKSGSTDSFTVALYEKTENKIKNSNSFDISYAKKTGKRFGWKFTVPSDGSENTDYRIILYNGRRGYTSGIGLEFINISLEMNIENKKFVPIYQMKNLEINESDKKNNYMTLFTNLIPGEQYYLHIDEIEIKSGSTDSFTAALYEKTEDKIKKVNLFDISIAKKTGKGVNWVFTVPTDGPENTDYRIILYSGVRGNTSGVGLEFINLSFEMNLENKKFVSVHNMANFEISSSDSNNNFQSFYTSLIPGETYYLNIGDVIVKSGSTDSFTAALYEKNTDKIIHTNSFDLSSLKEKDKEISWLFTIPEESAENTNYRIILYSGVRGNTSGVALEFINISLEMNLENKEFVTVHKMESFEIDKSDRNNNFKTLYPNLIPGETYYLNIGDVLVKSGSTDFFTAALYEKKADKLIKTISFDLPYLKEKDKEICWLFTVPPNDAENANYRIILYSGIRGGTSGVGLEFININLERVIS